jgi:putative transposase
VAPIAIMRRIKAHNASTLLEEFPALKKRSWGWEFCARGYSCAAVGQMTEGMIAEYPEHHFEPGPAPQFRWNRRARRSVDANRPFSP